MSSKRTSLRNRAYRNQHGRCFYCGRAMWQSSPVPFAQRCGLTSRQARQMQATAEHLLARCDGGKDTESNIVAACDFCNRHRHCRKTAPSPEHYRTLVQQRVAAGRWHCWVGKPREAARQKSG
ncbi:hypothetical protein UUA_10771 [Rhodanobacter thiooxydans LCS2]|nr:hypothetical protein UUA_10771 [Rhodanobacter thiooxydans LCS2]